MKIATWNLERLKKNRSEAILSKLTTLDPDILILTETDSTISLGEKYTSVSTQALFDGYDGIKYKKTENRVTIWTKYKVEKHHKTYDSYTSICAELQTPLGLLTVYGTIIGVFGGKGERFKEDLNSQIVDFEKLAGNSCLLGDLNTTFTAYVYPSHNARKELNETFEKLYLNCLTSEIADNVDHIAISKNFIPNRKTTVAIWNEDKTLSDHIGICITL